MPQTSTVPVSVLRQVALFVLPLLAASAVYCCWYLSFQNGFFQQISGKFEQDYDERLFPGTAQPLVQTYTGLRPLDRQLSTLVVFFAPAVENEDPSLTMFIFWASGQFAAAWSLLFMESLREGNQGKIVSWVGTYGVLFQNFTLAVTTPLYLLIHLISSPTAGLFSLTSPTNVLLIPSQDINVIPFTILLGFMLPSALMMSHGEAWPFGSPTHQYFIAVWQFFPVLTVSIHWLLRNVYTMIKPQRTHNVTDTPQLSPAASYLQSASRVYTFILAICFCTNLPSVFICAAPIFLVPLHKYPHIFSIAKSLIPPDMLSVIARPTSNLSFSSVFAPPFPLPPGRQEPAVSLTAGVHAFLQFDIYISSISCLLWGLVLFRNAPLASDVVRRYPNPSLPVDPALLDGAAARTMRSWPRLVLKVSFWTAVAGPFGALAVLLWERDGIVKQKVKQGI